MTCYHACMHVSNENCLSEQSDLVHVISEITISCNQGSAAGRTGVSSWKIPLQQSYLHTWLTGVRKVSYERQNVFRRTETGLVFAIHLSFGCETGVFRATRAWLLAKQEFYLERYPWSGQTYTPDCLVRDRCCTTQNIVCKTVLKMSQSGWVTVSWRWMIIKLSSLPLVPNRRQVRLPSTLLLCPSLVMKYHFLPLLEIWSWNTIFSLC